MSEPSSKKKFSKYAPVDAEPDELDDVAFVSANTHPSQGSSSHIDPSVPQNEGASQFASLQRNLISACNDARAKPLNKLEKYLVEMKSVLNCSYLALTVISQNHWLQTTFTVDDGVISLPTPAAEIHEYSVSRQLSEILLDDPTACQAEYSVDDALPSDLKELAALHKLCNFLIHGICNSHGVLVGMIVFGHCNRTPFSNKPAWQVLDLTLQAIMYTTLQASNLERYITFTESLKACTKPQEMIIIIARWMPYVLLGPWGSVGECRIAVVRSTQLMTLYRASSQASATTPATSGATASNPGSSKSNVKRMSSTSKILRAGSVMFGDEQPIMNQMILGHSNPLLASLKDLVPADLGELDSLHASCKNQCTMYRHIHLKGTLLENVIVNEFAVCIHDLHQHINDNPEGHVELLFKDSAKLQHSLLLLPMYKDQDCIYGGIYLDCYVKHDLSHIQFEAELLLLIASVVIQATIRNGLPGVTEGTDELVEMNTQRKAVRSHLTDTIGKSYSLEHSSEAQNLGVMHKVFGEIITDYSSMAEIPQICEPENIRISVVAGKGAFGVVYQGWIQDVNTISAVKVMMLNEKMDSMALLRNATEMAAMSKINHPNTIHILAYFIDVVMLRFPGEGSGPFFRRTTPDDIRFGGLSANKAPRRCCVVVMEYCAYGTLLHAMKLDIFRTLEPANVPDVPMICSVLMELASALVFLHKHGIIHSDLKPQNVLLKVDATNPRGFVTKLADFGLARVVTQAQPGLQGDSAGTPTHLAPEIVKVGTRPSWKTFKADVYAFGILMWELYMSKEAFSNVNTVHVLTKVALQGARPKYPPCADPEYVQLSRTCWSHSPEQRPSFEEIMVSLRTLLRSSPGRSNPAPLQAARLNVAMR